MAEILRAPLFGLSPVRLPGPTELDADTADVAAHAWHEGHTAGWREGHRDGRSEAADFAAQIGAAVERAVTGYTASCARARDQLADHLVELAEALVEGVLGHLPDTATQGVLGRLHHALEIIEDGPLTVLVHPTSMELMQPALDLRPGGQPLTLRADDRLAPGELVIEGPWAYADLTWPRLVEAARTALTEMRDADQDATFDHDAPAQLPGGAS